MDQPRVPAGSPEGGQFASKYNLEARFSSVSDDFPTNNDLAKVSEWEAAKRAKKSRDIDTHLGQLGKRYLNRHLTLESVARMAGAPPGASVLIEEHSPWKMIVTSRTREGYYSQRVIDLKSKTIYNEESKVPTDKQKSGFGLDVLSRQVEEGRAMGMHRIETYAGGRGWGEKGKGKSGIYNGYYTWPRMGFMPADEQVPSITHRTVTDIKGNKLDIIKLMSTKTGRDYWKDFGTASNMSFDLRPNSISSRVFDRYQKEKGR